MNHRVQHKFRGFLVPILVLENVWISSDYVICNQEEILNFFSLRVIPASEVILAGTPMLLIMLLIKISATYPWMLLICLKCCWFEQNVADMHWMLLMRQECCWYVLNVPDLPCRQVLSWRFIGLKLDGPKDWNWTAISPRKSQIDGLFKINKSFSFIKPQVGGSKLWKWTFHDDSARSFESEIVKTDRKYLQVKY